MAAPTWANYVTHGASQYPTLWSKVIRAFLPTLGTTGTTLEDLSGNNADGTFAGGMDAGDWSDDGGGYRSIDINSGGFVNCGTFSYTLGDLAVSLWVNNRSSTAGARFIDNKYNQGFWMGVNTAGGSSTSAGGGVMVTGAPYGVFATVGGWTHLLLTRTSAGLCTLYVNGVSSGTVSGTSGNTLSGNALYIGQSNTVSDPGDCKIDDVLIMNSLPTAGEIATLATRRGIIYEPAAVGGRGIDLCQSLSFSLSDGLSLG